MSASGISQTLLSALACMLVFLSANAGLSMTSNAPTSDQGRIELGDTWTGALSWYHTCPGDYNQDGLVSTADISPLGRFYGELAAPDAFPTNSQLSLIDGDQNGMLNSADLTPIGANFGLDILGGFNAYAADSLSAYPDDNAAPSKPEAVFVGHVALADTTTADDYMAYFDGRRVPPRLKYEFQPHNPRQYLLWWVRPVDKQGREGTPSQPISDVGLRVPRNADSVAQARWDSETSTLSWYYCNWGDYNQSGSVGVDDLTPIGVHYGELGPFEQYSLLWAIDGNRDGVIDEGDFEPIIKYFMRRLQGYHVYTSGSPGYYPASYDEEPKLDPECAVDIGQYRPYDDMVSLRPYGVELSGISAGTYLWVRPYDYVGYEGTPSNLVVAE